MRALLIVALLAGCGGDDEGDADGRLDAGPPDAAPPDAQTIAGAYALHWLGGPREPCAAGEPDYTCGTLATISEGEMHIARPGVPLGRFTVDAGTYPYGVITGMTCDGFPATAGLGPYPGGEHDDYLRLQIACGPGSNGYGFEAYLFPL